MIVRVSGLEMCGRGSDAAKNLSLRGSFDGRPSIISFGFRFRSANNCRSTLKIFFTHKVTMRLLPRLFYRRPYIEIKANDEKSRVEQSAPLLRRNGSPNIMRQCSTDDVRKVRDQTMHVTRLDHYPSIDRLLHSCCRSFACAKFHSDFFCHFLNETLQEVLRHRVGVMWKIYFTLLYFID